ncbi:MAG: DRTGG domain-containing protein [Anaerolineae bacterium]
MTLEEILNATEAEMLVEPPFNIDLEFACASDLMSDVLLFTKPSMLLVTGLTNPQAIRTADMAEAPAVVFVRGKYPPEETLELASEMGIGVLLSPYTMFETAGLLFKAGLKGIGKLPIMRQS